MIRQTAAGLELQIRVIPRASTSAVAGTRDGRILVRLAAPPVEGAANDALVDLLARVCDVPRRAIRVVSGHRSRSKVVTIDGLGAGDAARLLASG